jgi:predicted Mrr-cat superfamily restriction endonuclease
MANMGTTMKPAWAIRPWPHDVYRLREFLGQKMAAIGWPATGDLSGLDREAIRARLKESYGREASPQSLGQTTGILDRFVNQIAIEDAVVIPDGEHVYFGVVTNTYKFNPEFQPEPLGYPHQIGVSYEFAGRAVLRQSLDSTLFDALKGRQTVFAVPAAHAWDVIHNPRRYAPVDPGEEREVQTEYVRALSEGRMAGVNSPSFEKAVEKVLTLYFPGLRRLATTASPEGGDTDLKADLPGDVVVRVQVKCFRDNQGPLDKSAVIQLRNSMEEGEHGIVVTTNRVADNARIEAEVDASKPIGIIDGETFAQLVLDSIEQLDDRDLWTLGLRRRLGVR